MRRIRHLEQSDYIITVGQRIGNLLVLSNNCYLERTHDIASERDFNLFVTGKFNSNLMDGLTVNIKLMNQARALNFSVEEVKLYRISNANYSKTFIDYINVTQNGLEWSGNINQIDLGVNELSGAETYFISCSAVRRNKKFRSEIYLNHLGCFDSINRLRQQMEYAQITKLDE